MERNRKISRKSSNNYINNKTFYTELLKYNVQREEYDSGILKIEPRVNNYIAQCLMEICERLATKKNFSGYTYIDEMKSDALENMIKYVDKFNPNKSNNPFAYFTQIAWFAFLRRIQEEKRQQAIKIKNLRNYNIDMGELDKSDINDTNIDLINSYEKVLTRKRNYGKIQKINKNKE